MPEERQIIARIEIGGDCVLVYRMGDRASLVVTTRDNGDAEVFLDQDQRIRLVDALTKAGGQ